MTTVNYRDPADQQWKTLDPPVGATGPTGATGATGPTQVSADLGNAAVLNADGIFVAPVTQADTDLLYVQASGDTMTGALLLPDQIVTPPSTPVVVAAKGYVDQLITVSDVDPDLVADAPARDGLVWNVVEDVAAVPPPAPPTAFAGTFVDATTNTLAWTDSVAAVTMATNPTATYEIRYNLTGAPVTGTDTLLVTGVAAGVQTYSHTKDAPATGAAVIGYGIKAVDVGGSSVWVSTSVSGVTPTTTTLVADVATVTVGGTVMLTADTTADTGTVQFMKDGVDLGIPVAVDATGVAVATDVPSTAGTVVYGAVYVPAGLWGGSTANDVTVTVSVPIPTQITLTYPDAAAAGFTVSGAYTVDWGDGSAVESLAAGTAAAHTYAAGTLGTTVIDAQVGQSLTSFILTPAATSPTGIVFDSAALTHIELNSDVKMLGQVDFLLPVVLDSCAGLFSGQASLVSVTGSISSSGTNFNSMFYECRALTTVPTLDTSNGISFTNMFLYCNVLATIPPLETSNGRSFAGMFYDCNVLTTVPVSNTSNGTDFGAMFYGCHALTTVPALDFSNGTDFDSTFTLCGRLTSILAYGARFSIDLYKSGLDAAAINTFFTNLGTAAVAGIMMVNIGGAPGMDTCDDTIATGKGWIVIRPPTTE